MRKLGRMVMASVVALALWFHLSIWGVECPVHDTDMYFTGRSKVKNGHMFYLYRCPLGDSYWVRQD